MAFLPQWLLTGRMSIFSCCLFSQLSITLQIEMLQFELSGTNMKCLLSVVFTWCCQFYIFYFKEMLLGLSYYLPLAVTWASRSCQAGSGMLACSKTSYKYCPAIWCAVQCTDGIDEISWMHQVFVNSKFMPQRHPVNWNRLLLCWPLIVVKFNATLFQKSVW